VGGWSSLLGGSPPFSFPLQGKAGAGRSPTGGSKRSAAPPCVSPVLGAVVPAGVPSSGGAPVMAGARRAAHWPCTECGAASPLYDHQPERRWRHLDTCQYRTILPAEPPRSQCSTHGVRVVKLPWAEPSSRFTAFV